MKITMIQVPYDSGHKAARMGRGPDHLTEHGARQRLRDQGHDVRTDRVEVHSALPTEIGTTFEVNRLLAQRVRAARDHGRFPLVLAGNCSSSVGTLAGLDVAPMGVIWFDGHGDFNTPESTVTGFLDGMAIAIIAGRCFRTVTRTIEGFRPIPESYIVHVGGRDFDAAEEELLRQSDVTLVTPRNEGQEGLAESLEPVLASLQRRVGSIYLHVDVDVLDPAEARANQFAAPGGPTVEQVEAAIRSIGQRFDVPAAAITALDPAYDEAGKTVRAGLRLMDAMVSAHQAARL